MYLTVDRERQQQLEELTKDLARIQEECDMLRSKLKSLSKSKSVSDGLSKPHCPQSAQGLGMKPLSSRHSKRLAWKVRSELFSICLRRSLMLHAFPDSAESLVLALSKRLREVFQTIYIYMMMLSFMSSGVG